VSARVACSPVTWGTVLFERVLDDVAATGYAGVEAHGAAIDAFAKQPGRFRALLEERALALCAAPFSGWYYEREEQRGEIERVRRLADFLAEVGEGGLVVFRTVPHPARRNMVAGEPPLLPLDRNRLAHLADALNRYCDICRDFGLRGALQNRIGSFLETPDEYEEAIDRTEPDLVWLAPDVGHWAYAGGDVAALVRTHRARIAYPRLKDFAQSVFDRVRAERLGFTSFLNAGGFKELGEGSLDLEAALRPLVVHDYNEWVCVELERSDRPAKESAQISREYLRDRLHW
jgi:inosose dehydratase